MSSPEDWFAEHGYTLVTTRDQDGTYWVALQSTANPLFVVERYGRGTSASEAAERARRRWKTEQVG